MMELTRENFRAIINCDFRQRLSRHECIDQPSSKLDDEASRVATVNEFKRDRKSWQVTSHFRIEKFIERQFWYRNICLSILRHCFRIKCVRVHQEADFISKIFLQFTERQFSYRKMCLSLLSDIFRIKMCLNLLQESFRIGKCVLIY